MKCIIDNVKIKAIATCLPDNVLELRSLIGQYGKKDVENTIKTTGVERVHIAEQKETTSDLCFKAAGHLLESIGIDAGSIGGLIVVSQTFDYLYPATSVVLQDRLGLSKETVCFDISYGCSGYIHGLFEAAVLIKSGACDNVLMLAGDTNSKVIDPNNFGAKMVFGDAGSATLVTKSEGSRIGFHLCSDGARSNTVINQNGGFRNWPENTHGQDFSKNANKGDDVFSFIVSSGTSSIKTMLEYMEWNKDNVDFYGLHQATKFTLEFMKRKLKIQEGKAPFDIMNYGNTGPTTIPLVLTDYPHRNQEVDTHKWNKVILAAYGVGLSWGSVACDLSETEILKPINQDLR